MYRVTIQDRFYEVDLSNKLANINGKEVSWDMKQLDEHTYHILSGHQSYLLQVLLFDPDKKMLSIKLNGTFIELSIKDKYDLLLAKLGMDSEVSEETNEIAAPMPGLILDIMVKKGDQVSKGDPVIVLEAMKMENVIKSPGSGIVKSISIKTGANVEKNQVLIQF